MGRDERKGRDRESWTGGGDYFKYFTKGGRLIEGRLLFEDIHLTNAMPSQFDMSVLGLLHLMRE